MTTTTVPTTLTGQYRIDSAHSRVGFVARHAMVTKVRGSFNEFEGEGYFDAEDPSKSNLQLTIQATSIDTRNADRDAHLRSNDFFDMEKYPQIKFDFDFTGAAVDPFGNQRIGLEGSVVVNRKDWGVNWNAALEAGGVLVSENVTMEFEVSAIKAA